MSKTPMQPLEFTRHSATEMRDRAGTMLEDLSTRRSVRHFSTEPVPLDVIRTCIATAATAPSGAHKQPWTFVLLTDPATKQRIREAIDPIRARFREIPAERRWLVTSEGAFSYLALDFGLRELYLWPINADQQGTPQQVKRVIDRMRENAIPTIFSESTISPDPAKQVARETGARYGGVLFVDSLSEADGPVPTFIDLLRVTSQRIADGLTG